MRAGKMLVAMLTVGSLIAAAGLALAATTESKTPEAPKAPAVSAAPATSAPTEAKEPPAVQQTEKARATREKEVGADRIVRGDVTAVDPTAKTMTIKAMHAKAAETVGVDVPDTAKITQGKAAKTLADVKVGDRVWLKYDRMSDKLVADQIRILKSPAMAAKSPSTKKGY